MYQNGASQIKSNQCLELLLPKIIFHHGTLFLNTHIITKKEQTKPSKDKREIIILEKFYCKLNHDTALLSFVLPGRSYSMLLSFLLSNRSLLTSL